MSEQARELERRGQAISDAMGIYRGTEPLIDAVGRMRNQLAAAEQERDIYLLVLTEMGLEQLEMLKVSPPEMARIVGKTIRLTLAAASGNPERRREFIEYIKELESPENCFIMGHAANEEQFYHLRSVASTGVGYDREAWDKLAVERGF
jgi:hypothetical protein